MLGLQGAGTKLVARAFVDGAAELEAFTLDGEPAGTLERRHDAGFFEGPLAIRKRQPLKYRAAQRRRRVVGDRRLHLRPGARPDGRLLHARGQPPPPLRQDGRPPHRTTRAPTACTSPSGRRTPAASRWSATSTPGTAGATPCASAATPASGRSSSPTSAPASPTSTRSSAPTARRLPLKADPFARASELRPATASIVAPELDHDWGDAAHRDFWGAGRRPPHADLDLRGAPRLLAARRRALPLLGRARRPADPLRRRHGLHPHRVHADLRAPLRPVLGLPDHRPLRADRPLRPARGLRPLRRRRPPRRHRRHPRLGAGALPDRRARPRAASTAPRSTSTPTRARASTPTGTPRSSTSAARRSSPSCSTTRSTGRRSSTSTACASTPSPRCSTSTTPAARASGSPTSTAAARTSRRSPSCRR